MFSLTNINVFCKYKQMKNFMPATHSHASESAHSPWSPLSTSPHHNAFSICEWSGLWAGQSSTCTLSAKTLLQCFVNEAWHCLEITIYFPGKDVGLMAAYVSLITQCTLPCQYILYCHKCHTFARHHDRCWLLHLLLSGWSILSLARRTLTLGQQHTFPLSFGSFEMSWGPEILAAFVCKIDMWLSSCVIVTFLNACVAKFITVIWQLLRQYHLKAWRSWKFNSGFQPCSTWTEIWKSFSQSLAQCWTHLFLLRPSLWWMLLYPIKIPLPVACLLWIFSKWCTLNIR